LPAQVARDALMRPFQTFGVKAEFLGHFVELPGSLGIPDGFRQALGAVGLVAVVIGLGHDSTFQRYVRVAFKRFEPAGQVANSCLGFFQALNLAFEPAFEPGL
jgi:hypothetical protein